MLSPLLRRSNPIINQLSQNPVLASPKPDQDLKYPGMVIRNYFSIPKSISGFGIQFYMCRGDCAGHFLSPRQSVFLGGQAIFYVFLIVKNNRNSTI